MGIFTTDLEDVEKAYVDRVEDAAALRGRSFTTPWFQVDLNRSESFEYGTYLDHYPHPYGGADGYGEGLVEGFHLLGLLDHLINHSLYCTHPRWVAWNYGLDRARFVSVVRTTDRFRLRGSVTDVVDRGAQGQLLVLDLTGEVQDRDRPGFVATLRLLWTTTS